jgi:peptide/nickel transport system ATP-binding protein
MLQTGSLIRNLTVRELVSMMAALYPQPLAIDEVLELTGTGEFSEQRTQKLSGGQTQRVRAAVALVSNPELLVLDEPTTGLDATVEAEVLDLVEALRDQFDTAILFVSHNLGIVARVCERVGVLYAGRLIEQGQARELFSDPRHPYTQALLGCAPRLGMSKDRDRLDPIPGSLPPLGVQVAGCIYADRCPIARDRCRAEEPPLAEFAGTHLTRCFFPGEVPDIPRVAAPAEAAQGNGTHEALLKVEHLVKSYKFSGTEVVAVADVDLELNSGEVLGLVGESGSGKTSLAKSVVGLIRADGGEMRFHGADIDAPAQKRPREVRRRLQMVFQNPDNALNPRHTVRNILRRSIRLLGAASGHDQEEQSMLELARSVRLEPRHLDVRPAALSGGLKQRVAIARSFSGNPALVLCDEPTSALDVSVQAAILNLLVDLQRREDVSYIFISHDLAVVRYVADRIAVMYLGQVVEVGPADAVFSPPHHPYTEALLSAIPTLDLDTRPRIKLTGTLPSAAEPPSGCRFHTRCPRFLGEQCATQEPPWQQAEGGNRYRCHIPPDELATAQSEAPAPVERPA